jgi:hypothetical protein
MARKILVVLVVVASVFVSLSSAIAQYQTTPEEMTGAIVVNGQEVGTGYLVADRVVLACAHMMYNPLRKLNNWPILPHMIEFLPGKTIGRFGRSISRGRFRARAMTWQEYAWYRLASSMDGSEYIERSRIDYVIILLESSPGLGHFIPSVDDVPERYVSGGIQELGYPKISRGRLWGGSVTGAEFFTEKEWFRSDGLNAQDSQGASGGPFFYKNEDGKWVAFAIHNYLGPVNATRWVHRRITPDIALSIKMLAGM